MNKFVKGAFIFTGGVAGGFVLCGVTIGSIIIKSKTFREALKNKIADEISSFLYGETRKTRKPYKDRDVVFETRKEAENVLLRIYDIFEYYGTVSVSDVYDLCGLSSDLQHKDIGWNDSDDINKMCILHTRDGYQLIFPRTVYI